MLAISSFSQTGYDQYGKEFIKSFLKHWPGKLFLYTESPIEEEDERILKQDFFEIPYTDRFYQNIKNIPQAKGNTEHGYNYNMDLWKFSRKVFCQWDVLKEYKGKVFWLDADIVFKKDVPEDFLENLFQDKGIVYLDRPGWHSETGVVGFNTEAPNFEKFFNIYIGLLKSGAVFDLPRWHDCAMLDFAIKYSGIETVNLTKGWDFNEFPTLEDLDVFPNTVLAEYMTHYKGREFARKKGT